MSLKHKIAFTGSLLILLAVLLFSLLTGIYFYLPHYLESKIIPQLAAQAGIAESAVKVRNIGFFGADLGALRVGPEPNPALAVRSVQIDYSPTGLYRQKIDSITLTGVELYGKIQNGGFSLRGLDMEKVLAGARPQKQPAPASKDTRPYVALENLQIRNSLVILEYKDRSYRVPFDIDIHPQDPEFSRIDVQAFFYPREQNITASARLIRTQQRVTLDIQSTGFDLGAYSDITSQFANLMLTGEATVQGRAELQWEPFRLSTAHASLTLQRTAITAGSLRIQNISDQGKSLPVQIDLAAVNDNEWQLTGSNLAMIAPMPLILSGFNATIQKKEGLLASSGTFAAELPPSSPSKVYPLPLVIRDPLPLQARFSAQYLDPENWQWELADQNPKPTSARAVRLEFEPYTLTFAPPGYYLSAKAVTGRIDAVYTLRAPAVQISSATDSIRIPEVELKGETDIVRNEKASSRFTFELRAPNTGIKSTGAEIKISEFSVSGKLNSDDVRHIRLDGVMQFAGAGSKFSGLNARFNGARGEIPFKWPVEEKTEKGSVSIGELIYKDMNFGDLKSNIRQTPTGFAFEGQHQSSLVPNLKLDFTGESRLFNVASKGSNVRVELSRPGSAPEIDLGKLFPQAKGFRINGQFDLNGDFAIDGRGFSGKLRADLNDGRLSSPQNKLALEGIRMSLNFPELPRIRSAPGQSIQFRKFSLGDLITERGSVDFQIESARSFLIEKMRFLWCEGSVETQSMRLSPGVEDYRITFYCDRLNLAKVLEQFGAAAAEGRGAVNGRIPLQYAGGKISFDDGFLFSTPGDGGKIRLTGTDILTAGIPPNTPQFVQVELAREALKDYDYTWAKLNITSQGEELLLQMQMDGKPAKTLPFVYRKDIGGFVKVEADAKGSKFQGIRLDVNFRLPLNKLLQYKGLINMMK